MAFILGVLIGIALGYIIWADREERRNVAERLDSLEKKERGRGRNEPK